jgi:PA14 domain
VTATDSNGLFTSKIVNISPRKSELSVATSPAGLGLMVDGIPVSTPRTFTGVEGFQRELSAPIAAVAPDGTVLQFAGWSDGKSIRHLITTPAEDTTYTATYQLAQPFTAKYYDNVTFSGTPVLTRQDPNVNFVRGDGSPDPALPENVFSVRWTKTQHFGAGRYTFTAIADDGVRLCIWGAAPDQPTGSYRANYWNMPPGVNTIPGTNPELTRDEEAIDHDWGERSPGEAIGANRFAARWTRTMSFEPGDYELAVTADDGVRLYVDGVLVIDKWVDRAPTTYRSTLPLDGGPHKIVMEYYENGGGAVARLG